VEQPELIGRKIADKYVIESYLGGGGMGAVYRARQVDLDKVVAIKVLHPEFTEEAAFVARFKREAKAASRIDHPSSMRVLDFGQEPREGNAPGAPNATAGLLYIVMEYLDGRSLFDILRTEAPLEPDRIIDLFRQALAALAAAHDLGIVHRDLKPDNIVVLQKRDDEGVATEQVKVCDFGIAKFTGSTQSTAVEKLTTDGTIIGTPDYLSPEQARSDVIDARSDIYSMGVILFEALTGKTPFKSDTPLGVVLQHLDAEPPRPSTVAPGVDPRLEAICLRCLKKKPEERYATARDMRAALAPESMRPPALGPDAIARIVPKIPRAAAVPTSPQLTPPPVSSTPAPLPLLLTKKAAQDPRKYSRLTDVGGIPEPSAVPGVVFAVLVVAATAAAATWLYKGGSFRDPPATDHRVTATSASRPPPPVSPAGASAASPSPSAEVAPTPPSLQANTLVDAGLSFTASARPKGKKPAPAAGKADSPEGPRVVVGQVVAMGIGSDVVASAMPGAAFADCYRDALANGPISGAGKLHLEWKSGLTNAQFGGDPAVARLDHCLESAAKTFVPPAPLPMGASADVDLTFVPK
jgi:eukaryotic-like serine/threonine-protein kinase